MVNTEIKKIDYILCSQRWEALRSQQEQDWEPTVAEIMNSLLPSSGLAEEDIKTLIIHQKLVQNVPSSFIHDS